MDSTKNSQVSLRSYKKLMQSAVGAGVSFDDLIQETRNFYGDEFTLNLLHDMKSNR